ncbi:MAG: glycosyltransferase family 39 protein [Anaerolineae bacterium]|nr:glycosyltransferase family 39 protein [Anaerolineae bacterium]
MSAIAWRRNVGALALVLLAGALLRGLSLGQAGLIGDESYYWLWSKHLALSYYDNPAGVALLVRLSTLLGGESEAGIRWLNAALGTGAVWLSYLLARRLFSRRAGLIAAALVATGAPYLLVSRYVYTDALQCVLLLANLVLLAPFLRDGEGGMQREAAGEVGARQENASRLPTWRYAAVGLTMAALYNTKYSAYLYGLAVTAFLLWRRRRLYADWRTWLAIGIAACGLLPVLAWNAARAWASFRWQWAHFAGGQVALAGNALHAVRYLTPPLACAAALGVLRWRRTQRQLLLVAAAALVLPVLLSRADSPRNLLGGVTLLLVLAGDLLAAWSEAARGRAARSAVLLLLLAVSAMYGLGTVVATLRPTSLPQSSAAASLRWEGAGWQGAALGLDRETPVFALDYQIAGQLRYYGGWAASTAWPQYRLWPGPQLCAQGAAGADAVQVVALAYLDPATVSARLSQAFASVEGPRRVLLRGAGVEKEVLVWVARGCLVDEATFLERFDYLHLAGGLP